MPSFDSPPSDRTTLRGGEDTTAPVAILGANGKLGRATLDALLSSFPDLDVVAIMRDPARGADLSARGIEVRHGNYDEPGSLDAAFSGVKRLLLIPSTAGNAERVAQYENAIEAARSRGVAHLIHYGVIGGDSVENPFVVAPFLAYAEAAVRTSGLDWTILRNGLYAEPIVEWVDAIVAMGTIPYPIGESKAAFVTRTDIGRAGAAVLARNGHHGRVYHLTGPVTYGVADLCQLIAGATAKPVTPTDATDDDYITACVQDGTPESVARQMLTLYHAISAGLLDVVSSDIKSLTGKAPEHFETTLRHRLAGSRAPAS